MKKIILLNDKVYDWTYSTVVGRAIRHDYKVGDTLEINFQRYLPFEANRNREPWRKMKCGAVIKKMDKEFIYVNIE